jgi:hypothetical protein
MTPGTRRSGVTRSAAAVPGGGVRLGWPRGTAQALAGRRPARRAGVGPAWLAAVKRLIQPVPSDRRITLLRPRFSKGATGWFSCPRRPKIRQKRNAVREHVDHRTGRAKGEVVDSLACEECGERMPNASHGRLWGQRGSARRFCSSACRQRSYRRRARQGAAAPPA